MTPSPPPTRDTELVKALAAALARLFGIPS
jgi:hypothetical protein